MCVPLKFAMNPFGRGCFVLAGLLPALALGTQRTDLNAFLDDHVSSTAQLVRQVRTKPDVRDRYMRHFGMSENQVYNYLGSLRLGRLSKPEIATVYSVPGSGAVKSHRQKLHTGELVFFDPSGQHALLARCGNPLGLGPTNLPNMAMALPNLEDSDIVALHAMPELTGESSLLSAPSTSIAMDIPPDTLADVFSDVPPVVTTVAAPPVIPNEAPLTPAAGGNNSNGLAFLPLLGGGALLGILSSHHGGGGGGGVPILPAPTPEPVTLVFAALTAGVIAYGKRRHR